VALSVRDWLRGAGHSVFVSQDLDDGLRVGDTWAQRLFAELYDADALVAVVTGHFAASPWCAAEVGIAPAYAHHATTHPSKEHPTNQHHTYANTIRDA
jgi:hypothetical protein